MESKQAVLHPPFCEAASPINAAMKNRTELGCMQHIEQMPVIVLRSVISVHIRTAVFRELRGRSGFNE